MRPWCDCLATYSGDACFRSALFSSVIVLVRCSSKAQNQTNRITQNTVLVSMQSPLLLQKCLSGDTHINHL
jgi:hypothetical protein